MKEVLLEFLRNMKDEEYAKNIAYVIAIIACAIVVIIFMLKAFWKKRLSGNRGSFFLREKHTSLYGTN